MVWVWQEAGEEECAGELQRDNAQKSPRSCCCGLTSISLPCGLDGRVDDAERGATSPTSQA